MADVQLNDLLNWYPDANEPYFQTWITGLQEFQDLASDPREPIPKRGDPFKHQQLLARFLRNYDFCLAMHRTGTGKTCASIQSAELLHRTSAFDPEILTEANMGRLPDRDRVRETINLSSLVTSDPQTGIMRTLIIVLNDGLIKQFKREIICKCTAGQYETEELLEASSEAAVTGRVNKILRTYYTFATYDKFASDLKNKNDAQIEYEYSDSFFILDEIQTLRNSLIKTSRGKANKQGEDDFKKIYSQLLRLLRISKRSKLLLLSATPMVEDPKELALVMNLLHPHDKSLSMSEANYSSDEWTLDRIEPYLRGRISYVRELETGAIAEFQGVQLPGFYEIVAFAPMSDFQADGVLRAGIKDFYSKARPMVIFIYPDGTSTAKTLEKYVDAKDPNLVLKTDGPYYPTEEFLSFISHRQPAYPGDIHHLAYLSRKYQNIIDSCNTSINKSCFVYTDFVKAAGAITLAMCFQAQGYDRFMETGNVFFTETQAEVVSSYCDPEDKSAYRIDERKLPKQSRYALISGNTSSQALKQNILRIFNSYDNRHGEYIKVLIGSRTIREGVNLANVQNIQIVGSDWNQANLYQAISRGIRSTSHVDLINEVADIYVNVDLDWLDIFHKMVRKVVREENKSSEDNNPFSKIDFDNRIRELTSLDASIRTSVNISFKNEVRKKLIRKMNQLAQSVDGIIKSGKSGSTVSEDLVQYWSGYQSLIESYLETDIKSGTLQIVLEKVFDIVDLILITDFSGPIWNEYFQMLERNEKNLAKAAKFNNPAITRQIEKIVKKDLGIIIPNIFQLLSSISKRQHQDNVESITRINLILSGYQDPKTAFVTIEIFKNASVFNIRDEVGEIDVYSEDALNTTDIIWYKKAEEKDRQIRKVERYMKQCAYDGQIHRKRNIRDDPSQNGSPACDYQSCDYQFVNPEPLAIYRYYLESNIEEISDGSVSPRMRAQAHLRGKGQARATRGKKSPKQKSLADSSTRGKWIKIYTRAFRHDDHIMVFDGMSWSQLTQAKLVMKSAALYEASSREEMECIAGAQDGDLVVARGKLALDPVNNDNMYTDYQDLAKKIIKTQIQRNPRFTYNSLFLGSGQKKCRRNGVSDGGSAGTIIKSDKIKPRHLVESLINFVDNKQTVRTRFGAINYINEEAGSIFLQPEYPINPFYTTNQIGQGYYAQHFYSIQKKTLQEILTESVKLPSEDLFQTLSGLPKDFHFDEFLNNLDIHSRATILETAITETFVDPGMSDGKREIIDLVLTKYGNSNFRVQEPTVALSNYRQRDTSIGRPLDLEKSVFINKYYMDYYKGLKWANFLTKNKVKRDPGYKIYIAVNADGKIFYRSCFPMSTRLEGCVEGSNSEIQEETEENIIILHTMYLMDPGTTKNNDVIKKLLRANGRLRIYSVADNQWSDVNDIDMVVYSAIAQLLISDRFEPYNQMPIYGFVTPDMSNISSDAFRVVIPEQGDTDSERSATKSSDSDDSDQVVTGDIYDAKKENLASIKLAGLIEIFRKLLRNRLISDTDLRRELGNIKEAKSAKGGKGSSSSNSNFDTKLSKKLPKDFKKEFGDNSLTNSEKFLLYKIYVDNIRTQVLRSWLTEILARNNMIIYFQNGPLFSPRPASE